MIILVDPSLLASREAGLSGGSLRCCRLGVRIWGQNDKAEAEEAAKGQMHVASCRRGIRLTSFILHRTFESARKGVLHTILRSLS